MESAAAVGAPEPDRPETTRRPAGNRTVCAPLAESRTMDERSPPRAFRGDGAAAVAQRRPFSVRAEIRLTVVSSRAIAIASLVGRRALSPRVAALVACLVHLLLLGCAADSGTGAIARRVHRRVIEDRFTIGRLARQGTWSECSVHDTTQVVPRFRCGDPLTPGTRPFERSAELAGDVRTLQATDSTVDALHASAVFSLRWRDASAASADKAVALLERAHRRDSTSSEILNDLAVAYLEIGQRDQQLQPMLRALDAIEQAYERDSTAAATAYNRALTLELLYLVGSARKAWARYAELERDAEWRADGERRLDRLTRLDVDPARSATGAPADQLPQAARDEAFVRLGEWADAITRDSSRAATEALTRARTIGRTLDEWKVDRSVSLAVAAIDSTMAANGDVRALARAHVDFTRGVALNARAAHNDADAHLDRAERVLRAFRSPLARWAAFYHSAAEVNLGELESADARFRKLLTETTQAEPALSGKVVWALGVSQLRRGNYEAAIEFYRNAAADIARAREPENAGAIAYLLAEALNLTGQTAAGRVEAYRGLRMLAPFRRSGYLNNHLTTVAIYARGDGLGHAALAIMNEVLDVARATGRPQTMAWAHRARARELAALGRPLIAQASLDEASRFVDSIRPGLGRDRVRADVQVVAAELARDRDPDAARALLSEVLRAYGVLKGDWFMAAGHYQTSLAELAAGDRTAARQSLQRAITAIEQQGSAFESSEARATFLETTERVFDAMIEAQLVDGRPDSAFAYLERARAVAWSAKPHGPSHPGAPTRYATATTIDQVRSRLMKAELFVEYVLLERRLAAWIVSRDSVRLHVDSVSRDSIAGLIARVGDELDTPDARPGSARAQLFDLLIRPFATAMPDGAPVTIVPDRELSSLPFGALWDSARQRNLVDLAELRTVPSAAFRVAAAERRPGLERRKYSALVVGNPTLDSASNATLPRLPGAAREAQHVAPLYERSSLMTGADARRDAVVGRLATNAVFHFAGHAIANSEQPELSYLALAPTDSTDDGRLRGREIGGLRLSNMQLVVLSACRTLNPRASHVGAISGLAYSFLRAGVPATISTLWDVSDQATTELLIEFHRHYASGVSAAEALRLAQLSSVRSGRPELRAPSAWAAFIYTGP